MVYFPFFSHKQNRGGKAALVLAANWHLEYRTLRCTARCFDRTYVLGTWDARPLGRSIACKAFYLLPSPSSAFSAEHVVLINHLCASLDIDCVLPSDAETTALISAHKDQIEATCYPVPKASDFDLLNNKRSFVELCRMLQVPIPPTCVLTSKDELEKLIDAGEFGLPIVIKPMNREGSIGVHILLEDADRQAISAVDYEPVMVQKYIEGDDLCAFYFCENGKIVTETIYYPGPHALKFIEHFGVREECSKIIKHFHYHGIVGFDLRTDSAGRIFFLECNPRFWRNMDMAMLAGMNPVEVGLRALASKDDVGNMLAGRSVPTAAGLLRVDPLSSIASRERRMLVAYYLVDLPMFLHKSHAKLSAWLVKLVTRLGARSTTAASC